MGHCAAIVQKAGSTEYGDVDAQPEEQNPAGLRHKCAQRAEEDMSHQVIRVVEGCVHKEHEARVGTAKEGGYVM